MTRYDRTNREPSVPLRPGDDPESREVRVIYGPCDGCDGERPFLVKADDPILDEHEYLDLIVAMDEILEHCHFPRKQ